MCRVSNSTRWNGPFCRCHRRRHERGGHVVPNCDTVTDWRSRNGHQCSIGILCAKQRTKANDLTHGGLVQASSRICCCCYCLFRGCFSNVASHEQRRSGRRSCPTLELLVRTSVQTSGGVAVPVHQYWIKKNHLLLCCRCHTRTLLKQYRHRPCVPVASNCKSIRPKC
jgi:hypothetical protein